METNNLDSKNKNDTQNNTAKLKNKKLPEETVSSDLKLNKEVDIDADGNKIIVDRVRNGYENTEKLSNEIDSDNPNAKRGVATDKEAMKTVENEDLNSDITPNRYPNSHPDNKEDRGNMKLDE